MIREHVNEIPYPWSSSSSMCTFHCSIWTNHITVRSADHTGVECEARTSCSMTARVFSSVPWCAENVVILFRPRFGIRQALHLGNSTIRILQHYLQFGKVFLQLGKRQGGSGCIVFHFSFPSLKVEKRTLEKNLNPCCLPIAIATETPHSAVH